MLPDGDCSNLVYWGPSRFPDTVSKPGYCKNKKISPEFELPLDEDMMGLAEACRCCTKGNDCKNRNPWPNHPITFSFAAKPDSSCAKCEFELRCAASYPQLDI